MGKNLLFCGLFFLGLRLGITQTAPTHIVNGLIDRPARDQTLIIDEQNNQIRKAGTYDSKTKFIGMTFPDGRQLLVSMDQALREGRSPSGVFNTTFEGSSTAFTAVKEWRTQHPGNNQDLYYLNIVGSDKKAHEVPLYGGTTYSNPPKVHILSVTQDDKGTYKVSEQPVISMTGPK